MTQTAANTFGSDTEDSEVAARTQLANAHFHRLLDYRTEALSESIRATEELSQRMSYLRRKEIECPLAIARPLPPRTLLLHAPQRDQVERSYSKASQVPPKHNAFNSASPLLFRLARRSSAR
jgi:hypothetical protein